MDFIARDRGNVSIQEYFLNEKFPFVATKTEGNVLYWQYKITNSIWKNKYSFCGIYFNNEFRVKIISPTIAPSSKIHLNSDSTLCLYHAKDLSWGQQISVAFDVMPWTLEWILLYELYLINGNNWKSKEHAHI